MALATKENIVKAISFREVLPSRRRETFATEVCRGLSAPQKSLPSRFFYDSAGSDLFERITRLPEYYLTRKEQGIFEASAGEMIEAAGNNLAMMEFGSGSSKKTRLLIEAALKRQRGLVYVPIDISQDFLRAAAETLLSEYPTLRIAAIAGEYRDAISELPSHPGPRLILFLGSNIGNFRDDESLKFMRQLRAAMNPRDSILIGIDLLKERAVIEAAYNDAQGVTAEFNKNMLARINRELGGHFDLDLFAHEAPFVEESSGIEMRLVSLLDQSVAVDALGKSFHFRRGEWIHTEDCRKWKMGTYEALCASAGLAVSRVWEDEQGWYAVTLLRPTEG